MNDDPAVISETPDGPKTTRLEDLTNEQLLALAVQGSEDAANILADRGYGHQQ